MRKRERNENVVDKVNDKILTFVRIERRGSSYYIFLTRFHCLGGIVFRRQSSYALGAVFSSHRFHENFVR